ncbi:hypothetical protein FQN50_000840 [Emmonsiellopsis sp. PD_5]|nr:hypothetical protein FQN50_000840 [Emmonsiellopsis sp. PD_5]
MGIPLHYEPPARSDANNKPDPSATARSSIRRHRALRHAPRNGPGGASGRYGSYRSPLPQWAENFSREILRDTSDPAASRSALSRDDESRLDWPASTGPSSSITSTEREILGQQVLRDALRYTSPGRRLRIPRESSLRFEMPSPLWSSSNERSRQSEPGGNGNSTLSRLGDLVSFSPRFAPAYPPRNEQSTLPRSESNDSNMPLLRRVGHRSVSDANDIEPHRPRQIDGLGDRERSLSPGRDDINDGSNSDDEGDHAMWDTLLTTIQPDEHLPSFDSFTSASASAPFSRNSTNTSQTTLPSSLGTAAGLLVPLDPFPDHMVNACDFFSSSEGSDTEPESDLEHEIGRARRSYFRRPTTGISGRRTPLPPRVGPRVTAGNSNPNTNNNNNNTTQPTPTDPSTTESSTPSTTTGASFSFSGDGSSSSSSMQELQQMQVIIDRLARRQDIPNEWWAAVGLSRNLGMGTSSGRERGRDVDVPARGGGGGGSAGAGGE